MTKPHGKPPKRKLPERGDRLNVPLPFEDAVKAALETKPPPKKPAEPKGRKNRART